MFCRYLHESVVDNELCNESVGHNEAPVVTDLTEILRADDGERKIQIDGQCDDLYTGENSKLATPGELFRTSRQGLDV